MVPSVFVVVEKFPLTANGKIDQKMLQQLNEDTVLGNQYVAPRSVYEKILVEIWETVIGISSIGIQDDFFDIGGDSILSIQVRSRATQKGLYFRVQDIFEHPTIENLVKITREVPGGSLPQQTVVSGRLALTPIQQYFFETSTSITQNHFNQAMLITCPENVNPNLIEELLQSLVMHHDILRARFDLDTGNAQQRIVEACLPILTEFPGGHAAKTFTQSATTLQSSLSITDGPLLRAALFLNETGEQCLLVIMHHLIVDGVSWRILLEDLNIAYTQSINKKPIQLPLKTHSYLEWSQRLMHYSNTVNLDLAYWSSPPTEKLPTDFHPKNISTELSTQAVNFTLSKADTEVLLRKVLMVHQVQINDVLLTALVVSLHQWVGYERFSIWLEGHGREDILSNIDVSRTVGWFTSLFPVYLSKNEYTDWDSLLKNINLQLRALPHRGIDYGVLRYLTKNPDLLDKVKPEILFNYLGQWDTGEKDSKELFQLKEGSVGTCVDPRRERHTRFEINGSIAGGQLNLTWTYSNLEYNKATIESLVDKYRLALQGIITHCSEPIPHDNYNYLPVRELAMLNDNSVQYRDWKNLLPVQTNGKQLPLFMAHDKTGSAMPYIALSKYLKNQPVYGINNPLFLQSDDVFNSIEEMAAAYVKMIQAQQPKGPYNVGGWSFGGYVALEVARQLNEKGYAVPCVIILDQPNYGLLSYETRKAFVDSHGSNNTKELLRDFGVDSEISFQTFRHLDRTELNCGKLLYKYEPSQYNGRVILLRAQSQPTFEGSDFPKKMETTLNALLKRSDLGWGEILDNIEVYSVMGSHAKLMQPDYVVDVAEKIQMVLGQPRSAIFSEKKLSWQDRHFIHVAQTGDSILIDACFSGNMEININAKDVSGKTALHWAAQHGNEVSVRKIIEQKARHDLRDSLGNTPLMLANKYGHEKVEKYLRAFVSGAEQLISFSLASQGMLEAPVRSQEDYAEDQIASDFQEFKP